MVHAVLINIAMIAAPAPADTHEELLKESLKVITEVCDVMDKVKDKATAEQNKPKLKELSARMDDLRKRVEKLGEPTVEVVKKITEQYFQQLVTLEQRMLMVRKKLDQPEIKAVLGDVNLNPK